MKSIGWIFAAIAIGALIYVKFCTTPKVDPLLQGKYEALKKQTTDTVNYYEEILKADSAAIDNAMSHAVQSNQDVIDSWRRLEGSQNRIDQLTFALRLARLEKPDSSNIDEWMSVSPRYINNCDSLEIAADKQNLEITRYIQRNQGLTNDLVTVKNMYDTALRHRDNFNAALRSQLDACHATLLQSAPKKRVQFYAGMNLLGNKARFIDGGQLTGTLVTKKNLMLEVSAGTFNKEIIYGAGAKILISFRRQ